MDRDEQEALLAEAETAAESVDRLRRDLRDMRWELERLTSRADLLSAWASGLGDARGSPSPDPPAPGRVAPGSFG